MLVKRGPFDDIIDSRLRRLHPEIAQLDPYVDSAGVHLNFSIKADDGTYLGLAQIYQIDQNAGSAEIGIGIFNKRYWHKGYGRLSMNELLVVCSKNRLTHLRTKALKSNEVGVTFNESCGFTKIGDEVIDGMTFTRFKKEL